MSTNFSQRNSFSMGDTQDGASVVGYTFPTFNSKKDTPGTPVVGRLCLCGKNSLLTRYQSTRHSIFLLKRRFFLVLPYSLQEHPATMACDHQATLSNLLSPRIPLPPWLHQPLCLRLENQIYPRCVLKVVYMALLYFSLRIP